MSDKENNIENVKKEPSKVFIVDARSLHKKKVSILRIESDYYKIVLHYFGDYDEDLANGCLDCRFLSSTIYEKRFVLPIAMFKTDVFISTLTFEHIELASIDKFMDRLNDTIECATELQSIVNKFYPKDKLKKE